MVGTELLSRANIEKGSWEIIVGPNCLTELFARAEVTKNMQQLITNSAILDYHLALPAKVIQYDHENLPVDGFVFVRLPRSKSERTYMQRLKYIRVRKVEESSLRRYVFEENGKLRIKGGSKEDLPRIRVVWKEAKRRPSFFARASYVFSSFFKGLFGFGQQVQNVHLPFPLFRDKEIAVFRGTKKEARELIFEELRERYESKRDIGKIKSKIVLTPNLDHLRMLFVGKSKVHREVYGKSWLQVADGYPPLITFGMQSLGYQPKEQVTGVALFMELTNLIGQQHLPYTIYFIGGFGNIPYKTRDYFISIYPNLKMNFVGISTPPLGFLDDKKIMDVIIQDINNKKPDIIFAGLTNTTQERLPLELLKSNANFGILFGIGRSIELVSGFQKTPPKIFQKLHLEWLHRVFTIHNGDGFKSFRYFRRVFDDFKFAVRTVFID